MLDPVTFSVELCIDPFTFVLHMPGPAFPAGFFSTLGTVPVSLLDPVTFLIESITDAVTSFV